MGLFVIAGGQYGSEGKGKVAEYFATVNDATIVARVGGCNAGHIVVDKDGNEKICRTIPACALSSDNSLICFPAGSYINIELLKKEILEFGIDKERIFIDPNAMIQTEDYSASEKNDNALNNISSTLSGVGKAVEKRVSRKDAYILARRNRCNDVGCVVDIKGLMRSRLAKDEAVVIEGSQGYHLSLLHTQYYPYCTSRDTSIQGILSEVGLSYKFVDKTVSVLRSYPIRVGGTSGPLPYELTWGDVTMMSGASEPIIEYTSVTKKVRRVGRFDLEATSYMLHNEMPDIIVINHMDYIDYKSHDTCDVTDKMHDWLSCVEKSTGRKIDFVGTGRTTLVPM